MRLVIYSMDDLAGSNIARLLINRYNFATNGEYYYGSPIYQKKDVLLFGTHSSVRDLEAMPLNPEVCLVASRHRSESGKPTLTCHATGNFGRADLGGKEGTLQMTHAQYMRQCLLLLRSAREKYGLDYEVSMEVTHHGPTGLPFPLLYVEVGSTKEQWSDENACNAVAETIYEALFSGVEAKPSAVGFGGPHYAPNFNAVGGQYAVGHIMPKHAVGSLTKTMVKQMFDMTSPKPDVAIIDWKGLRGAEREALQAILNELGISWVKTSELK